MKSGVFEVPTLDGKLADLVCLEKVGDRRSECYLHYAYAVGAGSDRWNDLQSRRAMTFDELRNLKDFQRLQPDFFQRLLTDKPYLPGESGLKGYGGADFSSRTAARLGALELIGNIFSGRIQAIDKDPFPHQLALQQFIKSHHDKVQRVLIADEVGLGKTIEIGLVLRDLLISRGALDGFSCVYFTKGGLVSDAATKLRSVLVGAIGPTSLVETVPSLATFGQGLTSGVRVASLEAARLYTDGRKKKLPPGVAPEIVIIDECHRCASDRDLAGATPSTSNATQTYVAAYQLIHGLFWPQSRPPRLVILMSATPFRARNQFANLLRLLMDGVDGLQAYDQRMDERQLTRALKEKEPAVVVVWRQQDDPSVRTWKNERLFPHLTIVRPHSLAEKNPEPMLAPASRGYLALMGEIRAAIHEISKAHGARFGGFQMAHLEKKLTSSSLAGACSLFVWAVRHSNWKTQELFRKDRSSGTERLRELLRQISQRLAAFTPGQQHESVHFPSEGFTFQAKAIARSTNFEDIYTFSEKLAQSEEDGGYSATSDEIERVCGLGLRLLGFSDPERGGGVENAKLNWLRAMLDAHPQARYLVFTESLQTCSIVESALGKTLCKTLTGSMGTAERLEVAERFKNPTSKVRVLVATSAADEGFDFQVANRVVHWDVSTSPAVLMQRNGRVARLGQVADVTAYYLIVRGTHEERRDNALHARFQELGIRDERLQLKILGTLTEEQSEQLELAIQDGELHQNRMVDEILRSAQRHSEQMDADLRALHRELQARSVIDREDLRARLQRWSRMGILDNDELKVKFEDLPWERPVFREVTTSEPAVAVKATLRSKDRRTQEIIFDPEFKVFGPNTAALSLAGLRPWTVRRHEQPVKIQPDENIDPLGALTRRVARLRGADFAILSEDRVVETLPSLRGTRYLLFTTHPMREGETEPKATSAPYLTFYAFGGSLDAPLNPAGASAQEVQLIIRLLESCADVSPSAPLSERQRQESLHVSQQLARWVITATQLGEGSLLEEGRYFLPIPVALISIALPPLPVTHVEPLAAETLPAQLRGLLEAGQEREAMALLFDTFDDLHLRGAFGDSNNHLTALPVDQLPLTLLVGALTITAAAREQLSSREAFFAKVRARLAAELSAEELNATLQGLE